MTLRGMQHVAMDRITTPLRAEQPAVLEDSQKLVSGVRDPNFASFPVAHRTRAHLEQLCASGHIDAGRETSLPKLVGWRRVVRQILPFTAISMPYRGILNFA